MALIIPPYVATYASQNPYITADEFLNAPTGVDVSNLVPSGGTLTNSQTLLNVIRRASGWADSLCNQKLSATIDTVTGRWQVRNDGTIAVPLKFFPVIMVSGISTGWSPSTVAPLAATADVWVGSDNIATIPLSVSTGPQFGALCGSDIYATVQYVNGWSDAQLSASAAAGATSVTVTTALGVVPGQSLQLYSSTASETVQVAATFAPSITTGVQTVQLAGSLANAYPVGATLTGMPQEIKQAVICLTSVLIKTRATESMAMASIHQTPMDKTKMESGASDDFEVAVDLLTPFKRPVF